MLSPAELHLLVTELNGVLGGARVQKIHGPAQERITIEFFKDSAKSKLLIALEKPFPRLHLTTQPADNPQRPFPLTETLRRELHGARLKSIEALDGERIVRLNFQVLVKDREDERFLIIELFPQSRNLMLLDAEYTILALIRPGGARRPELRNRGTWRPPPPRTPAPPPDGQPAPESSRAAKAVFAFLGDSGEPSETSLSEAIETWVLPQEKEAAHDDASSSLGQSLRKRLKKERRLFENLQREFEEAARGSEYRRYGELIKAHMGTMKRGMSEASLQDFTTNETVTVPLESKETPLENMNRYFAKAKKLDRSLPKVATRLGSSEDRVKALEDLAGQFDAASTPEELEALWTLAESKGYAKRKEVGPKAAPKKKKVQERRKPYRLFISKDGLEILVGRTAADNDELSMRIGKGNEPWFHVDGYPGSHVVVRCKGELPPETLLDAVTLAAHFSQAPKGGRYEIHRTQCKFVSKFRGARAGQVQLASFKSIRAQVDPVRLDRLVNSRPEGSP